eukprot:CAMPEP_0198284500 /NCGR_PEP_ID=MMETSP1449-20131203/3959_1 /TAXON_ID=420275 /ORGANISM="Attheya septentrionalis, Strain CCMP2084" /LENGTH=547 /DNA_ID=CAMNT_0043981593 /DNA_START=59 /DNA_END=1702 /DNA_ORIENTATION=-
MDFVDLASSSQAIIDRFLAESADDDFSHLSGGGSSHSAAPAAVASGAQGTADSAYYGGQTSDDENRPLLSPAAETELFMLATNFLLYVAMVIIITMVAKIYFPGSLERGTTGGPVARSVSYVRTDDVENGDASDESPISYGSDAEDSDDCEENDELLEEDETDNLLEMEGEGTLRRTRISPAKKSRQTSVGSSFLEFDQETASRQSVLKRLSFCVLMLNVTFVTWGVLQERMLTRRYPRFTGEYFTYSYALVFTNRFWTLLMSGALLLYLKPRTSRTTVLYEYSFPSITNMLSSWCQYEALRYVSFPAVTLFKSFKLAPVMAMGKILGNKSYPQYDYFVALVIAVGITMFMSSSDDLEFGYDVHGDRASEVWTGIMLMSLFLFFDSFTSQWQSRMFQRHRDLSMIELMFATSAFSTVLSLITLIHTGELGPALSFVYRHSEIHLHFFMFSICSTIGQLFIFYTIKNFGAVVFAIIMTTRVLISIALSCIMYGHQVTSTGFLGLVLVVSAVGYRISRKLQGKQLVKWQGMGDEKASELVQEWHEHVDM